MTRWYYGTLLATALLAALLLAALPRHLALAQGPEPVKIRVETVDAGFKCAPVSKNCLGDQSGDFIIEVEQGSLVELTFAWAHVGYAHEEHIMVLPGYRLETDKLTSEHREATMKFVADKPGSFNFKCDLECEVHDYLQRGRLKVSRGGSGGAAAAALTPTALALTPSSWVTAGDPLSLMAVLKDAQGTPVSKGEVRFYLDAEFAGTKGKMEIGTAKTDKNGVALLSYRPALAARQQKITAHFEGMGVYGESQQAVELQEVGVPPPAYTTAPVGLESIRHWAPTALAAAVLAVWSVFGFVLYQAIGIARVHARR
ncbi:MAG: Ig-like domain repeat protein [Chloroflexi bacterium]|nr:Ig-like domain repeat protein [Chloroflexota bacterium]